MGEALQGANVNGFDDLCVLLLLLLFRRLALERAFEGTEIFCEERMGII